MLSVFFYIFLRLFQIFGFENISEFNELLGKLKL